MPDPGLSRASEDAGSLAVPSTRAIGPYVGGAACRFVASRWPWRLRLLAGPGSRIPSCWPACSPGVRGVHVEAQVIPDCTDRPRRPHCRVPMLLSGTLIGRGRVPADPHARVTGHARRCALKCAMCALHAAFYMLQAACCIYTLRIAICALHGRMLRAALYMAAWCTPRACVRPIYDETAHEAHRCRATTAQPRREILIIQSGPVTGGYGRGVRRSSSYSASDASRWSQRLCCAMGSVRIHTT